MQTYKLASCLIVPALLLAGAPAHAQSKLAANPDVQGSIRLFEAWMEGQMRSRDLPGVAVGVVYDQDLVWAKGFGVADTERKMPVTPRTKFRMASHTKLFTAMAIMQLRDAGKLRLDDPVVKYLPWFKIKPLGELDQPVTIENLLTHISGLPREVPTPYWMTFEFPSPEDVQRLNATQTATYSPHTRWKYSNLAFTLAGMIVETVSGERYQDYLERHILTPLGMKDSTLDREVDGLAVGYGRRMPDGSRERMKFMDTRGVAPAAGLTSSVEDMAKFISLQFRNGRPGGSQILSGPTLREMHRVRVLVSDWSRGNGLGFAVDRVKDKVYVGHGGSLAGYKSQTYIDLDGKVGVVVMSNGDDSRPAQIAQNLMQTVGDAVAKAAKPEKEQILWDPEWSRFAGLYRSRWGDAQVVELNRRLVMIDPDSDDPGSQQRLEPLGKGVFRLDAGTGWGASGEEVRFEERNGKVVRIHVGQTYMDRVR